ncbi:VOC family protein [Streptomonospora litoralis]|uniref:Glyoxalase-like domain protein n=1 Tax=Streptomonospora litoralis TaxID=2498135 RepID=A0A4P6Q4I7_9ACTN|nr:VOC family protein [Streptomonospora litoralis]QBI55565.1 Glyoxalase-like domain protein [Streptomonospora litoralis]
MPTTEINAMLLASRDPERLHDWYSTVFEPQQDTRMDQYRILKLGSFHLLIDSRDDIAAANPDPGRVIINVDVDDARAVGKRIDEAGSRWLSPIEDRDGSLFGTAIDPDGNYVQLIQLSEEARQSM